MIKNMHMHHNTCIIYCTIFIGNVVVDYMLLDCGHKSEQVRAQRRFSKIPQDFFFLKSSETNAFYFYIGRIFNFYLFIY